uniref:transposase n=1 Tax=Konateibacter massiliensis TaxID=2002841 RepID=UPI001F3DFF40|nr:transposase [Konateibacter massiliensis]
MYECENCNGCAFRSECNKGTQGNRTVSLKRELTKIHQEVINNLESIHGALLCMNRSIQSEGTFGIIKWDRSYKRLLRRGANAVILGFRLISCGYNLYKYYNKRYRASITA